LVLAQTKASVVATSDLVDIERLLSHIEKNKEEAVLSMKNNKAVHLFYFKKGLLRDAYFEETEGTRAESDLRDKLLLCAYSSSDHPLQIALYEDMTISPATDQEAAENQLSEAENHWSLEVLNGDREGERIDLGHENLSFGRGKVDIRLNDPEVSRFHAAIEYTNKVYVAINQASTNGLFVNDEKIERKQLSLNDVILLGDTRFRVVCRK
ncbi:MAG: FHA domain-containing protein, partial [Nitrospiria bacterium]